MTLPIVSVIIPVYNTGKSAVRVIDSLINGEYQHLDIIIVDDGSTDDSLKILKKLEKTTPSLRVFHKENGGASSARNFAIKKVKGEYIAFIDSDDDITPDYLAKLVAGTHGQDVALAVSAYMYHRVRQGTEFPVYTQPLPPQKQSETFKAYILRLLMSDGRLYAVINKLFRTDIIKKYDIKFDTTLDFAEDTKFVLDYLAHYEGKISFILEPLYVYHFGSPTSTVAKSSLDWANWQRSFDDIKNWVGPDSTREERKRLNWLYRRFKISHALAVARANIPFREKRKYASTIELAFASIAVLLRR